MKSIYSRLTIVLCFLTLTVFAEESDDEFKGSYKKVENPSELMLSEFSKAKIENKALKIVKQIRFMALILNVF